MELNTILEMMTKFAKIGGALWTGWGVIVLAGALKDKNGPDLKAGIWQIVGGAMIIAAAIMFGSITT